MEGMGKLILTTVLVAAWIFSGVKVASAQLAPQTSLSDSKIKSGYDPLDLLAQFLNAVYPDLADHQGLATLKIHFDNGFVLGGVDFEFHPCRMSGVSAEASNQPDCGASFPNTKPFLSANIDFGRNGRRPIMTFTASGTFIDDPRIEKIQQLRQGLHKEWSKEDALEVLRSTSPRFGPDREKEFLASLPFARIEELTGCRLRPESTEFDVRPEQIPRLQFSWTVHGAVFAEGRLQQEGCWTSFEPFAGRLTAIGATTP
jgi:hypothetical protein